MERMPSTACCRSSSAGLLQQRVLLFGSVRCEDQTSIGAITDSWGQVFGHGRAQELQHLELQHLELQHLELEHLQEDEQMFKRSYFIRLGGGTSSHKH